MGRASSRIRTALIVAIALQAQVAAAGPDSDFESQRKVLLSLSEFAEGICASVKQYGSSTKALASLDAQAQLKGLTKKLADVGFDAKGKYSKEAFEGVTQADLPRVLDSTANCKLKVIELYRDTLFPAAARANTSGETHPPHARAFPLDEYIDRGVHRVGGSLNVAVAVQGAPNAKALLDALHRALIEREMSVVPLFREKFRQDGTAQRLFGGDAGLAANLKLRDYVDSVLLAEFHFVGPAQAVQGNLYIREAVLEVHAIDPASGEVRKVLEIREKGGGATAEQSSENALTRLEQSIANDMSGWVWV